MPWWLSRNSRKDHPYYCSYTIISGGTSLTAEHLSHDISLPLPHLPCIKFYFGSHRGSSLQLLALEKIMEKTIGIMCTFSEGNGRFLIAIITTNIMQCLWATDNTLGVMKSLNSRLSPTSSSRLKCHGLCWPDHRNGKHKWILPTSSSKALETWASFPRNGGYQIHHVCLGSLFFPIFNYSGREEKKRERERWQGKSLSKGLRSPGWF